MQKVKCPICGKDIELSRTDMNHLGGVCSHRDYDVKIYLEER